MNTRPLLGSGVAAVRSVARFVVRARNSGPDRPEFWRELEAVPRARGALRLYYVVLGYSVLVFSYLWRAVGTFIVATNTWASLRDPVFANEWMPAWEAALLLLGVLLIGHLIARAASWWIRYVTGRPPWSANSA